MATKARARTTPRSTARAAAASPPSAERGKAGDTKPIAAVERALQVLTAFRSGSRLTLSELSQKTGLFKSTLLRILSTLEKHGYVTRLSDGQYRVGAVLFELGSSYVASFDLAEIVKPALATLSRVTGESASFYVRSDSRRLCMFRAESPQTVRHAINVGQVVDLDGAAISQLLRRHDGDTSRPKRSVDYATLCIATAGVGDSQTASVAAPIFNTTGFIGAMSVSGPVGRFTDQSTAGFRTTLAKVAKETTTALGGFTS
jgi:DNA-binding IclR family transcriptional regulator